MRLLAGLQRSSNSGAGIRWEPLDRPEVLGDEQKARRMIRYLALNPCRAGLVDDPLSWPWSTHRDVVGAVSDPWVTSDRLAHALGQPKSCFVERHHEYVSADPSVSVVGTPPPRPASRTSVASAPLGALVDAAASATRAAASDICLRTPTRDCFLKLAANHGWHDVSQLAALCDVAPRTVRRHLAQTESDSMTAAELCLGDPRLRRWRA